MGEKMRELKLAYLAGVIDSDGCIHIERYVDSRKGRNRRYQYNVRLQIGMTRMEVIEWIGSNFFGETRKFSYKIKSKYPNRNDITNWRISSRQAISLLKELKEYLVLKKDRAEIAIEFEKSIVSSKESRSLSLKKVRERKMKLKEELYNKMKELNMRGVKA